MDMLSSPFPRAWNTEEATMVKPPTKKHRLKVRRAGTPMASISSEAWNTPSSWTGKI